MAVAAAAVVSAAIGRLIYSLIFDVSCIISLRASQYHVSTLANLGKLSKKGYFVNISIYITVSDAFTTPQEL